MTNTAAEVITVPAVVQGVTFVTAQVAWVVPSYKSGSGNSHRFFVVWRRH